MTEDLGSAFFPVLYPDPLSALCKGRLKGTHELLSICCHSECAVPVELTVILLLAKATDWCGHW